MRVNPDPAKFYMQIAHGMKAEPRADAPDVEVPFCRAHNRWPCIDCGSKHFDACECGFCVVAVPDKYEFAREAAGYAVGIIRGMLSHWKKAGIKDTADELERYADVLTKFSNGDL